MTDLAPPRPSRRWWSLVPVAALLAFTAVLRAPIGVIPPLLPLLRTDLALTPVQAGLLTAIPVLCFGAMTPVASVLLRRTGINHGALYCLLGIIGGSLVRSSGGVVGAYAGTVLIGAGITIGNLVVPMLIGRQFQHRAPLLTGAYSGMVNTTVTAATAVAVPMALAVGWQASAASWGVVLGAVALVLWLAVYPPGVAGARASVRRLAGLSEPAPRIPGRADRRTAADDGPPQRRLAVLLTIAFCGHTFAYYGLTGWLPTALADLQHMTAGQAGAAASLFQGAGVVGPLLVPVLAGALHWTVRRLMTVVCLSWVALPLGLLVLPGAWALWSLVGGAAQGALFTALFLVVIQRARSVDENRRLTASIQTVGYVAGASGPVLFGWVHQAVGGWTAPFLVGLVALLVMTVAGVSAVRVPVPVQPVMVPDGRGGGRAAR